MNEELSKLINNLTTLGTLNEKKNKFYYYLDDDNKQGFIESYCKKVKKNFDCMPTKPKEKDTPLNPNVTITIYIVIIALGLLGVVWCYLTMNSDETNTSLLRSVGGVFAGLFGISFIVTGIREIKGGWFAEKKKYEDAINFNKNEYPKLYKEYEINIKEYNDARNTYEKEILEQTELAKIDWDKRKKEAIENLPKIKEEIGKNNILDVRYYPYISRIINILKRGRAETLSSAINVLENDLHNERMIELEEERNSILLQQAWQAERREKERERQQREYQEEMREIAERQAIAIENQTKQARKDSERAERQSAERRRLFEEAQSRYNYAINVLQHTNDSSTRKTYEERKEQAYSDMLKYK